MASKTGLPLLAFVCLAPGLPLVCQDSPLKWPVPPPGPPRQVALSEILIEARHVARTLAAGAVPLDVRDSGSYERGHLPGAVLAWSLEAEGAVGIERLKILLGERGIGGDRTVILYGDSDREAVARLFWLLHWAGCSEVRILQGGLAAWRAAGHPLETGISRHPPVEFHAPLSKTVSVNPDWVAGAFGQAGVEILDVRDARGWDRWQTPPTFGAGHIPYSLPFDPRALLPSGDGWPEPAEIRQRLSTLGPRPGDAVDLASTFVLYSEDSRDPRLGLGYLLLTLAGLEARVFRGGWAEWVAGGARPVARVVSAADLAARLARENPGLASDRKPRELVLLDLREARDFAIGHLPGALSLPFRFFTKTFERTVEQEWPGADRTSLPVVFYCYGTDCVRSRQAGAQAAQLGFRDVIWFRGGVREWRDAGLPLLETPAARAPAERASPAVGAVRP